MRRLKIILVGVALVLLGAGLMLWKQHQQLTTPIPPEGPAPVAGGASSDLSPAPPPAPRVATQAVGVAVAPTAAPPSLLVSSQLLAMTEEELAAVSEQDREFREKVKQIVVARGLSKEQKESIQKEEEMRKLANALKVGDSPRVVIALFGPPVEAYTREIVGQENRQKFLSLAEALTCTNEMIIVYSPIPGRAHSWIGSFHQVLLIYFGPSGGVRKWWWETPLRT